MYIFLINIYIYDHDTLGHGLKPKENLRKTYEHRLSGYTLFHTISMNKRYQLMTTTMFHHFLLEIQ